MYISAGDVVSILDDLVFSREAVSALPLPTPSVAYNTRQLVPFEASCMHTIHRHADS